MNDGQQQIGAISFRYSRQSVQTLAGLALLVIIVDIAALLACTVLVFYLEYVPWSIRLGIVAVLCAICVPTVLYARYRRAFLVTPLRDGSLAKAEILMTPDGLLIGPEGARRKYDWADLVEPISNTEFGTGPLKALLLSGEPFPDKPTFAQRSAIIKAAMNSPWAPVEVDNITVAPLRFIRGPVADVIEHAKQFHRQARHER